MQIYGLRLNYFMRFGEKNNSVVFDLSPLNKKQIENGELTLDDIYDQLKKDPVSYINEVKSRGATNIIGILGASDGNSGDSNGAGKSSIMEGICYAHYDKVVRKNVNTDKIEKAGLSVSTRINGKFHPSMQESFVEEIFEDAGKIYRIKRGRKFSKNHNSSTPVVEFECYNDEKINSLTARSVEETNNVIESIMPMDYDLFVNSVMFGQNDAGKFLTGTDKTRKEMIGSLLRIEEIVSKCIENIRKRKNEKDKQIEAYKAKKSLIESLVSQLKSENEYKEYILKLKSQIVDIEKEITIIDKDIISLSNSDKISALESIKEEGKKCKNELLPKKDQMRQEIKPWEDLQIETDKNIDANKKEESLLRDKLVKNDIKIKDIKKKIDNFDLAEKEENLKKSIKHEQVLKKYEDFLAKANLEKSEITSKIGFCNGTLSSLEIEKNNLESNIQDPLVESFICPKCKSNVSKSHIENEIGLLVTRINSENETKKSLQHKYDEVAANVTESENRLKIIRESIANKSKIESQIKEFNSNKNSLTQILQDHKDIEEQIAKVLNSTKMLQDKKKSYAEKVEEIKNRREKEIKDLQDKLDILASKFKTAENEANQITNKIKSLKDKKELCASNKDQMNRDIAVSQKDIETRMKYENDIKNIDVSITDELKIFKRLILLEDIFGLDGIRTRIIERYLPLLNVYIKEFLDILTNGKMEVKLVINDKSKVDMVIEGGMADTFQMLSGGEKMVTRIAVDIALALLSFSRNSQKPEIICLDEIFAPLDDVRTEGVFKVIQKLQDRFSRVLVISHKDEIKSIIDNNIYVEKDSGAFGMSKIVSANC